MPSSIIPLDHLKEDETSEKTLSIVTVTYQISKRTEAMCDSQIFWCLVPRTGIDDNTDLRDRRVVVQWCHR